MRRPCSCLILLALLSGACDRGAPTPSAASTPAPPRVAPAPTAATTPATALTTTALGAVALPDALDKARVQQLVTRWLEAQNDSDMEDYRALYATRMVGVKRAGARVSHYNASGWFKDREVLFRRALDVTIDEVEIIAAPKSALVRFRQSWEEGELKQVSVKQLVVIEQDDGMLRIAREEMLSEALMTHPQAGALSRGAFTHVHHLTGLLALDLGKAAPGWQTSDDATLLNAQGQMTAPVDELALPAALRALTEERFKLYSAEREVCEVSVTGFKLLNDVIAPKRNRVRWRQERMSQAQIVQDLYHLPQKDQRLIGVLQPNAKCANALFGRAAALPEPHLYAVSSPKGSLAKRMLAAFAKTDIYQEAQREHLGADDEPWLNGQPNQMLVAKRGDDTLLLIGEGEFKCEPYTTAWTTWRTSSPDDLASWREVPMERDGVLPRIEAVVDLDHDGVLELVSKHQLFKQIDGVYESVSDKTPIDYTCPC